MPRYVHTNSQLCPYLNESIVLDSCTDRLQQHIYSSNCICTSLCYTLSVQYISSPRMDLSWTRIFVGTLTLSGYKAPISPIPVFLLSFFTLLIFAVTWTVILYPKLFSSIRHLPGPSVSPKSVSNALSRILLTGSQGWLLPEWPIPSHHQRPNGIPFSEMD